MAVTLNGKAHGWVSVQVLLPELGLRPVTISELTYPNFTLPKEHHYGTGKEPVGKVFDSLKIDEGGITLRQDDADTIAAAQGSVLGSPISISLIVSYASPGVVSRTDKFMGVDFTGFQDTIAQGTAPGMRALKWKPDSALINGIPVIPPESL